MFSHSTTRGVRNNNPFNIRYNYSNKWIGLIDKDADGFCIFDNMDHGIRAGLKLLSTYCNKYKLHHLSDVVNRFAPSSENNTYEYYSFLIDSDVPDYLVSLSDWLFLSQKILIFESSYVIFISKLERICVKYNIKFN